MRGSGWVTPEASMPGIPRRFRGIGPGDEVRCGCPRRARVRHGKGHFAMPRPSLPGVEGGASAKLAWPGGGPAFECYAGYRLDVLTGSDAAAAPAVPGDCGTGNLRAATSDDRRSRARHIAGGRRRL